jgi:hypothetical protein
MTDRRPIQYAAGSLAASAFVAVTQILAGPTLDLPLYVALVAFAINIPFQIILFFMPVPLSIEEVRRLLAPGTQGLSQRKRAHCLI